MNSADGRSIAFILCVESKKEYDELSDNVKQLICPKGFERLVVWMQAPVYNSAVFNKIDKEVSSKYKVYIKTGIRIVNINFINDMLRIFSDEKFAMLGFWGSLEKPIVADWQKAKHKIGKAWFDENDAIVQKGFCNLEESAEVKWLDGCCFATQYALPWNEEFGSSYFSMLSHCEELARIGKKLVVPHQEKAWCHYTTLEEPVIDTEERAMFLRKYAAYLISPHENTPMDSLLFYFGEDSVVHEGYKFFCAEGISVGNNVNILNDAWLMLPFCNFEGTPRIIIGDGCDLGHRVVISASNKIILEENVLIAANVHISDHNHNYELVGVPIKQQGISSFSNVVVIGRGTWLGNNVVVAGNVKIGKGCVVGAHSLVNRDIPAYCVAVGSPARVVKAFDYRSKQWLPIRSEEDLSAVLSSRPQPGDADKRPAIDMHIYERQNIVQQLLLDDNCEAALREMHALGLFLFRYNQVYTDDRLEQYLLAVEKALDWSDMEVGSCERKENSNIKVLFYNGFAGDTGEGAWIYLEALAELGCDIVYVTKDASQCQDAALLEVLQRGRVEAVKLSGSGYVNMAQDLASVMHQANPDVGILYTEPNDVAGVLTFNHVQGKMKRYLINVMDYAFWLGRNAFDYCIESRAYGAALSENFRKIPKEKLLMLPCCSAVGSGFWGQGHPFAEQEEIGRLLHPKSCPVENEGLFRASGIGKEAFVKGIGDIIRHNCSGFAIEPYDIENRIEKLQKYFYDCFIEHNTGTYLDD